MREIELCRRNQLFEVTYEKLRLWKVSIVRLFKLKFWSLQLKYDLFLNILIGLDLDLDFFKILSVLEHWSIMSMMSLPKKRLEIFHECRELQLFATSNDLLTVMIPDSVLFIKNVSVLPTVFDPVCKTPNDFLWII